MTGTDLAWRHLCPICDSRPQEEEKASPSHDKEDSRSYLERGKGHILPPEKPPKTVGRPIVRYRTVLDGILYVLRTGCQWKSLPKEYGSGSTCHRRFQEWVRSGVFQKLWVRLLEIYDDVRGIKWRWQSLDSASVKAPLGGTRQVTIQLTEAS